MADTAASPQPSAPAASYPAKKGAGAQKKAKNPRAKPSHPPTSEMVNNAIKSLKERGGSSLQAIKKYISANYKVDAEKMSPFIKKYLKAAVASGGLVQTKGKGASGSFKLSSAGGGGKPASEKPSKPKAAKPKTAKAKSAVAAKKPTAAASKAKAASAGEKKAAAAAKVKKSPAEKKAAAASAAKPKSPSKAKKTTKGPTKKPKAPKPKRAKPTAAAKSAKKPASPKKK